MTGRTYRYFNGKLSRDDRRNCVRLSSADADGIVPGGDDGIALFGDHAEVTVLEFELNGAALARIEMDAPAGNSTTSREILSPWFA